MAVVVISVLTPIAVDKGPRAGARQIAALLALMLELALMLDAPLFRLRQAG